MWKILSIATQVKTVSGTRKTTQSVHYLLNEYEDLSLNLHKPYEIAKHSSILW